jgi:peptidyl-tRNA hydrolase, PTH1 family
MIVVIGLGNPGDQYKHSRHNVGFMGVDLLAHQIHAPAFSFKPKLQAEISKKNELLLVKPQTYMNRSGQAARAVLEYFTDWQPKTELLDWVFVLHDDLDLAVGSYKLQLGTGPKQHNGLLSLYEQLGTQQFWHGRIGVDGRAGNRAIPPDQYVLQAPAPDEKASITQSIQSVLPQLLRQVP